MRSILLVILLGSVLLVMGHRKPAPAPNTNISNRIDTIHFKTAIQPILQKNCSPCHFPGGKMYDKMPFDKGETIIAHEAALLKRLNSDPDVGLIRQFIENSKH